MLQENPAVQWAHQGRDKSSTLCLKEFKTAVQHNYVQPTKVSLMKKYYNFESCLHY